MKYSSELQTIKESELNTLTILGVLLFPFKLFLGVAFGAILFGSFFGLGVLRAIWYVLSFECVRSRNYESVAAEDAVWLQDSEKNRVSVAHCSISSALVSERKLLLIYHFFVLIFATDDHHIVIDDI